MIIRMLVLAPILILLLLGMLILLLLCALFGRRRVVLRYARGMIKISRAVLGIRVEAEGLAGLDRSRPVVYMANHESMLEGPILFTLTPRAPLVIIKKSLFRLPVLGPAMRFEGFVPVDRSGINAGRVGITRAAGRMKEERDSFLVFPEGTRSRDGRLQPFRRGGFFLAAAAGAPIVPVSVEGADEMMPRGRAIPRRGRIRIVFHPALETRGLEPATMPAFMERVRNAIASGMKGERT